MPIVAKRPLVLGDLAEIWAFIADDSETQADRFLATVDSKLKLLATQPHMGRLREDLMGGLRSFPVGRYVVFFMPLANGIEVVRVIHSARDIDADVFQSEGND